MNLSSLTGFLLGVVIIVWAIVTGMDSAKIFLNPHGIIIVFGGTIAAALVCFSFESLFNIFKILIREFTGARRKLRIETINEIVKISKNHLEGAALEDEIKKINHPFLRESLELYSDGTLDNDELEEVLFKRVQMQNERFRTEGLTFKTIGKFPPAFGLIGTTLGMIALLQGIGGADAFSQIGPSMSVALTATFWGLILANLVLVPFGENLTIAAQEDLIIRRIVVDGVLLLREKKHPILVEEFLKSYLPPKARS